MATDYRQLLERTHQGDTEALDTLMGHFETRLQRVIDSHPLGLPDGTEIQQVIGEVRSMAEERLPEQLDKKEGSAFLWIRGLTRECLDRLWGEPHTETISKESSSDDRTMSVHEYHQKSRHDRLLEIDGLPDKFKEVLILRHVERLTNDEVAEVMEIPLAEASSLYVRALMNLNNVLRRTPKLWED